MIKKTFSIGVIFISILSVIFIIFYIKYQNKHDDGRKKESFLTVIKSSHITTLYFPGIFEPYAKTDVVSMVDGLVKFRNFNYGDEVKKGQLLFLIFSEKFQNDYKTALIQYIKAKSDFDTNQTQLNESHYLYENKLISRDDFNFKQTAFYNSQLSLMQANLELSIIIKKIGVEKSFLENMKIQDISKIKKVLNFQDSFQSLSIFSPASGVILLPNNEEGDLKNINSGHSIKQGEILANIADLHDFLIQVNVNEFNINQLKFKQKAIITCLAIPNLELQGEIIQINKQGKYNTNSAPTFLVSIKVPVLNKNSKIRAGMSAKVTLQIEDQPTLSIPLRAIVQKNDHTYVNKIERNGKRTELIVVTGPTTIDSVVIEKNLNPGDTIVVPDQV